MEEKGIELEEALVGVLIQGIKKTWTSMNLDKMTQEI